MKILFYNHTGKVSGAERVLLMILRGLDRRRFEPVVLCPADGRLVEMVDELKVRRVELRTLEARFTWRVDRLLKYFASFVRLFRAARAAVIDEAPGVIHANSIRAGLVMSTCTIGLGTPIIWHVHDLLPRHPLSAAIRLAAAASRRTRVVAVSQAVADRFQGKLSRSFRGRVHVIHNAVDTQRFSPDPESRARIRHELGLDLARLIGIVGQLTPRKGQLELIEAFNEVARRVPDAALLIVGDALFNRDEEYAAQLETAAKASGLADRIHFLGAREDVPDLMRAMDLLVVNSRVEPFGLTVIEAMAAGTPVLAIPVDGIKEIIRHDENGWLLSNLDRCSLVDALRRLLSDARLRARLGQEGRRDAVRRFAADRLLNEIQAVYRIGSASSVGSFATRGRKLTTELSAD